ncbi:unnamed protein product [Phaeothamnion confervicola]
MPSIEELLLASLSFASIQVSRGHLLQHAEQIMRAYATSKAQLEFRFQGERGMGAGVTASFYSAVAAELRRRSVNLKAPMWVDSDTAGDKDGFVTHPMGLFPRPVPPVDVAGREWHQLRRVSLGRFRFLGRLAGRCLMDGQVLPLPLASEFLQLALHMVEAGGIQETMQETTAATAEAWASAEVGRGGSGGGDIAATDPAAAPALSQGSLAASVPLSLPDAAGTASAVGLRASGAVALATTLFRLEDLPRLYGQPGTIVLAMYKAAGAAASAATAAATAATAATATAEAEVGTPGVIGGIEIGMNVGSSGSRSSSGMMLSASPTMRGLPLDEWLAAAGLAFVDPLSNAPLIPGGAELEVRTATDAGCFAALVTSRWLGGGIVEVAEAFCLGLGEVAPLHKLMALTAAELRDQLCGEDAAEWPEDYLLQVVAPGSGYTRNSEPFRALLRCLSTMDAQTKRHFLTFVTGCPHLPPGGLGALTPPLEVTRKQGAAGAFATAEQIKAELPFARTCTHTLHLPPYPSLDLTRAKLLYAMYNSRDVIDRD